MQINNTMAKRIAVFAAFLLVAACSSGEAPSADSDPQGSEVESTLDYTQLDTEPAPILNPQEALKAFRIAPGFNIELVAFEPLVEDPVAMAWDEYSRLYVVEMRGYMPDIFGNGKNDPVGQIVRLSDIDGDGVMDESEVFMDKLINPRAVAVVNEGILVGVPPDLWLCRLPEPNAVCDQPERIGDYGPDVGKANVEHMENGLLAGIDNWLYNSKSARSFRYRNGELEVRMGPKRGQWGIAKDDLGRLFYNHNSTWLQGDLFFGEDLFAAGGERKYQGIEENLTETSLVYSVRVNPGVNRAYIEGTLREDGRLNKSTGVSGLAVYRGDQFPERFSRDVFIPESAGNVVSQFRLSDEGMSLKATQQLYADEQWGERDFLGSTDERFRPVDAFNGPDGALYIVDMYRGIIQDSYYMSDELRAQILQRHLDKPVGKGRIWRVTHEEGKPRMPLPNLGTKSALELVELLGSDNGWTRDTAQRLLIASEADVAADLQAVVLGGKTLAAIHALWTLEGRGELDDKVVASAFAVDDPWRQIHALRAGSSLLNTESLLELADTAQGMSPLVAMQWAIAVSDQVENPSVSDVLKQLVYQHIDNAFVRQAVVVAVAEQELGFLRNLLADASMQEASQGKHALLSDLAAYAYRQLRGDLKSEEPAPEALGQLIAVIESATGAQEWQQIAMLDGLSKLSRVPGFHPALLESAPTIFTAQVDSKVLAEARRDAHPAFTWPGDLLAAGVDPLTPEQKALMAKGETFYMRCAGCHGTDGAGLAGLAPPLAGVEWVTGPPEWLGRIILQGMAGPLIVEGKEWNGVMPAHGHISDLDDETLAGLMTYLRRSWGNMATSVSVADAASIRAASQDRKQPWTVADLEKVPFDRGFGPYLGKYSVSFITINITEEPEGLTMSAGMAGNGVLTPRGKNLFAVEGGDTPMTVEFIRSSDGPAESLIINRDGQTIPAKRKDA
ncbi:cytochrome c, class I [Aequoribacter fuscus]|uniref:Cytochrome c, class I n=1 Tax=Aequoribacter fuscus TaxID=2518989 RepID=F3KY57_9GAMM|nr:c-type cytochrome [Aequoribacter fuscus]EGG30979.1 cytochrome c, class I [Aequoribacter fuscus]QHJ88296.1 cytochrome c, class I [Aequoribacter fuscus]